MLNQRCVDGVSLSKQGRNWSRRVPMGDVSLDVPIFADELCGLVLISKSEAKTVYRRQSSDIP